MKKHGEASHLITIPKALYLSAEARAEKAEAERDAALAEADKSWALAASSAKKHNAARAELARLREERDVLADALTHANAAVESRARAADDHSVRATRLEAELARLREGIRGVLDRGVDNPAYRDLAALLEVPHE